MGSKGQIQRYAVLKVANYKVCPRILKYYQEVLAVCLHKNLEIINYPNQEELLNTDISVQRSKHGSVHKSNAPTGQGEGCCEPS